MLSVDDPWELIKSYIPPLTPAANLHWKAYDAGQAAQEMKDDVLISKVIGLR